MWIINDLLSNYFGLLISVSVLVVNINGSHHDKQLLMISPMSAEVIHFVNDSHIVTCSVNKGTKIKWINPKGNVVEENRGRIHVEDRSLTTVESKALVFEQISVSDKGNWTCVTDDDSTSKSFRMIVNEPISFMDTPTVQSAQENNDATIRCEVKGDPEPAVSWYFNGLPIILPNDKFTKLADGLLVKKVSRNDSGEYLCKAFQVSTTISNVQEQTIRLNVQHKPIPVKRSVEITYAYINGVLNLTCEAIAEPQANFTWYRAGKRMTSKTHTFYSASHVSYLQVFINSSKDYGDYKCKAENDFGTIERVITINAGVKPDPPTTFYLRGVNFDTFDIDVGASKTTNSPTNVDIIGYRFEFIPRGELEKTKSWLTARRKDFSVEDGVTYLITHLLHDTVYAVRVASRNAAGLSNWTETKIFSTQPLQPHGISSMGCVLDYSNVLLIMSLLILINSKN